MEMFNPPHPGEIIREDCIKPLGLTVTGSGGRSRRVASNAVGTTQRAQRDFHGDGATARKGRLELCRVMAIASR